MGGSRAAIGLVLLLGVLGFVAVGAASSQEGAPYQPSFGDLVIEGTDFLPGSLVTLSGDGFAPNAPLQVSVRSNASGEPTAETSHEANGDGGVRYEFELGDAFVAGNYTATVSGPAVDGATVELAGVMIVYAEQPTSTPTPVQPSSPAPTPTTQAAIIESPTATPLPEITVRNDPPPTPGELQPTPFVIPTPTTEGDDPATGSVDGDSSAVTSGATSQAGAEEQAVGSDDETDTEVLGAVTSGPDDGSSSSPLTPVLAIVAVIAVLGGIGGIAAWRQRMKLGI